MAHPNRKTNSDKVPPAVARMPDIITIPSTTRYLGAVRRFVETHAQELGFSADDIEELKLAVDEACTNIINHAYSGEEFGTVELSIAKDKEKFTIIIRDKGRTFEMEHYREPDLRTSLQKRRGGGYGVFIMRNLMDDVRYHRTGETNEVHLIKWLPDRRSDGKPIGRA